MHAASGGTKKGLWKPLLNDCQSWADKLLGKCTYKCKNPPLSVPQLADPKYWKGMGPK